MPYRSRRFRISLAFIAALRLVVNTAHRLVYPFLPAIARGLGVSLEQAGLLVSARWIAGLGTPGVVRVVGRGEQHRRLIGAGLAIFTLGAAITSASNVYLGAVAGFVLMGIAKPLYDVSSQAYVADRVPYAQRARYLGIVELTWAGGLLVGAPAAGWLIDRAGWNAPFWVLAGLAAAAVALHGLILDGTGDHHEGPDAAVPWGRSAIAFLVAAGITSGASEVMFVVLGAWLEDRFALSLVTLGGVAMLIGAAELVGEGSTVAFTDRLGKRTSVAIGIAVAGAGFLLLAGLSGSLHAGMAGLMVAYLGFEFTIVSSIPLASEMWPRSRARFLAWMVVTMYVGRGVGAAVGPVLYTAFGVAGNALVAALANMVALGIFLGWVRDLGDGAAAAPPAVPDSGGTGRRS
ncbi:MAG: MFS transporter [Acidimicrobiia bacterium]